MKTANPALTDGPQALVAGAAFRAYCDMSTQGGGWTLIQSHNASASTVEGMPMDSASGKYMPADLVLRLALASSDVMIRIRGTANFITSADSYPITQLQQLKWFNDDPNKATAHTHWTTNGTISASQLDYTCDRTGEAGTYPSLYWACGNGNGLHIMPDMALNASVHGFSSTVSQDLDVFVR